MWTYNSGTGTVWVLKSGTHISIEDACDIAAAMASWAKYKKFGKSAFVKF